MDSRDCQAPSALKGIPIRVPCLFWCRLDGAWFEWQRSRTHQVDSFRNFTDPSVCDLGGATNSKSVLWGLHCNNESAKDNNLIRYPDFVKGIRTTLGYVTSGIMTRLLSIALLLPAVLLVLSPGVHAIPSGVTNDTNCAPGTALDTTSFPGLRACVVCNAGYWSGSWQQTSCTACSAGTTSNTNHTACINCPGGYSCAGGADPVPCSDGYYARGGNTTCAPCPVGRYSQSGMTTCWDSDPGYYVGSTGQAVETPCAEGHYQPNSSTTACVACDAGKYAPDPAATSCLTCGAGSFVTAAGSDSLCVACGAGYYNNATTGVTSCTICAAGTYANQAGTVNCSPCPIGYYVGTTGARSCTPCPAGTYQATTGATSCTNVPATKVSGGIGATAALSCLAGQYPDASRQFCQQADVGFFVAADGSAAQAPCPAGTYSSNPGAAACVSCPVGTYSGMGGSSSCTTCPVGHFALTGASSCTACSADSVAAVAPASTNEAEGQCITDTLVCDYPNYNCNGATVVVQEVHGNMYATMYVWVLMGCMVGLALGIGFFCGRIRKSADSGFELASSDA